MEGAAGRRFFSLTVAAAFDADRPPLARQHAAHRHLRRARRARALSRGAARAMRCAGGSGRRSSWWSPSRPPAIARRSRCCWRSWPPPPSPPCCAARWCRAGIGARRRGAGARRCSCCSAPIMRLRGRLAWTPGGFALPFGRMLQDGIVARFLAEHCPDPRLKLCEHRDELPADADVFFWGESVFDRLGRFDGLNAEMRTIVLESIAAYPRWQIAAAARAAVAAAGHGQDRRRRARFDLAHARHDRKFHPVGAAGHARGPPAAAASSISRPSTGCMCRSHSLSMMLLLATLVLALRASAFLRPRTARRHRRAGDRRQCGSVRRARQSARPLRRAHGVARHLGGR